MNGEVVKKITYHFQDLVTQKNIKTFKKFLVGVFQHFKMADVNRISHTFINEELKNIYAFLKEVQHHQCAHQLGGALKPLFEMLLNNLIIPEVVYVGHAKYLNTYRIKYTDLVLAARRKRINQITNDYFVIPYKGRVPFQKREKTHLRFPRVNWVFDDLIGKQEEKIKLSLKKYNMPFFNFVDWSEKQVADFVMRLGKDYFNSESKYLPREFFNKGIPDVENIPEGW